MSARPNNCCCSSSRSSARRNPTPTALVSVLLYGSAARGDFIAGRSDLNLLVTLQSIRLEDLTEAASPAGVGSFLLYVSSSVVIATPPLRGPSVGALFAAPILGTIIRLTPQNGRRSFFVASLVQPIKEFTSKATPCHSREAYPGTL